MTSQSGHTAASDPKKNRAASVPPPSSDADRTERRSGVGGVGGGGGGGWRVNESRLSGDFVCSLACVWWQRAGREVRV